MDLTVADGDVIGAEQHDRWHSLGQFLLKLSIDLFALRGITFGLPLVKEFARLLVLPVAEVGTFRSHVEVPVEQKVRIRLICPVVEREAHLLRLEVLDPHAEFDPLNIDLDPGLRQLLT